jgi:tetratricopeptide (TPR) repeat protein
MSDEDDVDWDADQLVRLAERELRAGEWREACDYLRRALGVEDDHALAHALLAISLIGMKRLAGAQSEATKALAYDGGSPYSHYAAAAVAHARGKHEDAWGFCQVALGGGVDHDTDLAIHILGAQIRQARGELDEARMLLERALQLAPARPETRVAFAKLELAAGRYDAASRHADEALRTRSTDIGANVIAGKIDLASGDVAAAERHARFALQQDSLDHDALALWAQVKTRHNPPLGLLWRGFVWLSTRDEEQQIGIVLGTFVITQLAMILANATNQPWLQANLMWLWVAICVGTYWGPAGLQKLLSNELGPVDGN